MVSPRTPPAPFQVTIRGLLITNLYLAVLMTGAVMVVRSKGDATIPMLVIVSSVLPQVFLGLTVLLIHPGPRRDLLIHVFLVLNALGVACWATLGVFVVVPRAFSSPQRFPRTGALFILGIALAAWCASFMAAWACVPRRCPVCQRLALVDAHPHLRVPGIVRDYFWCAACGARRKRGRLEPVRWEDASGLNDDRFYSLGTPRTWLRRILPFRTPTDDSDEG